MTDNERRAIGALVRRVEHIAIIVQALGESDDTRVGYAVSGLGEVLSEAAIRLDEILNP